MTDNPDLPLLEDLEAAVQRAPGDTTKWRQLAQGYRAHEMWEPSVEAFAHAIRFGPHDVATRHHMGRTLLAAGRAREAIEHFREAARLDTRNLGAHSFYLGKALARAGERAAAAEQFRKVVQIVENDPGVRVAWVQLAAALIATDQQALAIPVLEKAIVVRPKDAGLWAALGSAYAKTNQHLRAVQAYRLSLRIDATKAEVHFNLGNSCRTLGRLDEARAAFEESVRLDPTQSEPFLELGSLLLDQSGPEYDPSRLRPALPESHDAGVRVAPEDAASELGSR